MMDTSEQYIKMCDCPEIQEQWILKDGDWMGSEHGVASVNHINENDEYYSSVKFQLIKEGFRWLPRQDQTQEMMPECKCYVCLIERVHKFLEDNLDGMFEAGIERGMEQLWLAFYMWEKHKKIWNGKEWLKKR